MKINEPEIVSEQQQAVVVDSSIDGEDKGEKKKRGRKKKAKEAKKPVEEEPVPVFKPTDVPKTPKVYNNLANYVFLFKTRINMSIYVDFGCLV